MDGLNNMSLGKLWFIIVACLVLSVAACHPVPAHAGADKCTGVLKSEYESKKRILDKSKMSLAAHKLSRELLDYYYEDQWLICKQQEKPDAQDRNYLRAP